MKIQCDMCEEKEAGVYCTADEASLCHGCDRRVHHANKLANKHLRFSLNNSTNEPSRCDICQERRAFLFCKEDRAILCRECDVSIHRANERTQFHDRFLLSGIKLSDSSSSYGKSSSDRALCCSNSNGSSEIDSRKSSIVSNDHNARSTNNFSTFIVNDNNSNDASNEDQGASMAASSISQYLMETLPGWHVEEFLEPTASHPYGLYEGYDTLPFMSHDSDNNGDLVSEDLGILLHSSSSMDHHQISKRLFMNEVESLNKLNKDQHTFTPSSIKRSRQLR